MRKKPDKDPSYRIGLTAPESLLSREIRAIFRQQKFPVSRFVPFGAPKEEGKLSDIDGEASFLEAPRPETVADLDFLILTGSDVDAQARSLARDHEVAIHDASEVPAAAEGCLVIAASLPDTPLAADFTLLLPAAEELDPGIHELFAQIGDALNLRPAAAGVFRERLAFNLFRDAKTSRREREVRAELAKHSGDGAAISVFCARAGIFHGYAGSAIFRFRSGREAQRARNALAKSPLLSVGKRPGHASPAQAAESSEVRLDPPVVAGEALSLWFAFDGLALAARRAFAAARSRLG